MTTIYEQLKEVKISKKEKDVENIYREHLKEQYPDGKITSPYGSDGLLECKTLKMLLEFKYDELLKEKIWQCNVLIQMIYYLKKFEEAGERLPSILFVGDINECFAIHTNAVLKYLGREIDWKIAPSEAHTKNPSVIKAMIDDVDIAPYVFDVDEKFNFKDVIDKINTLNEGVVRKVRITRKNVSIAYDTFIKRLLPNTKLVLSDSINLFIQILTNPKAHFIKNGKLYTESYGTIDMDEDKFNAFFGHFDREKYSAKEKEVLISHKDILTEDISRRNNGEFFTPIPFVDLAHKYIAKEFGENWKEEYIVWDPACGTMNLTRDYIFNELYVSTLEEADLKTTALMNFNPGCTRFQFDFLNDEYDKLPEGLRKAIEGKKKIIVLMNPPYGTAGNNKIDKNSKKGICKTRMQDEMKLNNWKKCTEQLYAQFLYRLHKFSMVNENINLCMFTPSLYLVGESFKDFRNKFLKKFGYINGFLFGSGHFSGTSDAWGVLFSIMRYNTNSNLYNADIYDNETQEDFIPEMTDKKELYNTDKSIQLSKYIRVGLKGKKVSVPNLSSACNVSENSNLILDGFIGYLHSSNNNIEKNNKSVALFSSTYSDAHGLTVLKSNFLKTNIIFTARKLISGKYVTWINHKDNYLIPNENHPDYEQFMYDSIVYSLFNNSSQQSSLRKVEYKGKLYDIKNEYFWMSNKDMETLANDNELDFTYNDAKYSKNNRYIYEVLFGKERIYDKLSPDAKNVLDFATKLVIESMNSREIYDMQVDNKYLQVLNYDAGYAQLKGLWEYCMKDQFEKFREMYNSFADRMRPLVHELGFLKK